MSEMVERVAQLLHNTWDDGPMMWDEMVRLTEQGRRAHVAKIERTRASARQIIAAMREPTEAMTSAGDYETLAWSDGSDRRDVLEAGYRAMIDAALKEGA